MVRITEEIKNKMIEMRRSGSTYSDICKTLGVKTERCRAYLRDINPDPALENAMTKEWELAEREGRGVLEKMGFSNIHNLNEICSVISAWDYLGCKNNEWWLVDVTINGQKSIAAKRDVSSEGYKHAILLKIDSGWKLIKISTTTELEIKI
jgi:hypothetical protein